MMLSTVNAAFLMLLLLFIKHFWVDFVNQTEDEVKTKGIYGKFPGVWHSVKHGVATALIVYCIGDWEFDVTIPGAIIFGLIDAIMHYHFDFWKMRYGTRDITTKAFWAQLGLDQLAHAATYLGIVWIIV